MVSLLALVTFAIQRPTIVRDSYGVPTVTGPTRYAAWTTAGFAVAQDRMWQMETSRRLARGRLSEIFGEQSRASDVDVLKSGYTDEELNDQFRQLSPATQEVLRAYADGVNRFLNAGSLPPEFAKHKDQPEPWTVTDSVAIAVRLFQEFGKGGAGELRNLAFLEYLKSRATPDEQTLDIFDDFSWQNDPAAYTTVAPQDDPVAKSPPEIYPAFDRTTTKARLAEMPIPGLLDLFPAIRSVERWDSHVKASALAAPFRTGSYCVAVAPSRSVTRDAMLLSGPQMGFRSPSVLHEMTVRCPGFIVSGADVPGMPGIVVGRTSQFAWGITSGVADTEDIVWSRTAEDGYVHGGQMAAYVEIKRPLKTLGKPDSTIVAKRTVYGPVVLENRSKNVVFSRHSAYRNVELRSLDALFSAYTAKTTTEIDRAMSGATMNFNFFYATRTGDIGYRYTGWVPLRARDLDPRLPTPDEEKFAWKGFVPPAQMPHVLNPKSGLLVNWNNKPTAWWPNGDTPAWGRIHEANSLFGEVSKPVLGRKDLERAVSAIAQEDETWPFFKDQIPLPGYDGRLLDGDSVAGAYRLAFDKLRSDVFTPGVGTMISPDLFKLAVQPTLLWNAIHGKTRQRYPTSRSWPLNETAGKPLESYRAPSISYPGEPRIPYSNRGTFIQIVEMSKPGIRAETVLPPGEAAAGPHANDQIPLARSWTYKHQK